MVVYLHHCRRLGATSPSASVAAQDSRQPEMGEDTAVPEPGDGGDLVPLEGEHHQAVRTTDPGLGVGEIAAEGRLAIGPRGGEPERSTAQGGTIVEEARDRRVALILEGLG